MIIDSHAHLSNKNYGLDLEAVITRARDTGIEKIINIATSLEDAPEVLEIAKNHEGIYAAIGIHPNDDPNSTVENVDWEKIEKLLKSPKVIAVGECGLDYYRLSNATMEQCINETLRQRSLLLKQIDLAQTLNLPVILHIRNAQDDIVSLFKDHDMYKKLSGVFHCFSGNLTYLDFILTSLPNFYISFAGNVTFKHLSAGRQVPGLQELAKLVPVERLLVETDCPYLSPDPLRGSRNEPATVKITTQRLAEIKNLKFEDLSKITSENSVKLFNL